MQESRKNTHFLNAPVVNYFQEMGRFSVNPKLRQ